MHSHAASMRWWLALAFAAIAAITAFAVAQLFTSRSESALRERAKDIAAGSTLTAALEISNVHSRAGLRETVVRLEQSRRLALFVVDDERSLLTPPVWHGTDVRSLPNYDALVSAALSGRREIDATQGGRRVVVALPLVSGERGAVIAIATRPDLEAALGIVRTEIARAALIAFFIAAVVGLVVALLITLRIRRISAAASEIEEGNFERPLRPRFRDEIGSLAIAIDGMRERLRASFLALESERDRLQALLEQLHEGVIAVDRSLVVQFANSRAQIVLEREVGRCDPLPEPWPGFSLRSVAASMFVPDPSPQRRRVDSGGRTLLVTLLPASSPLHLALIVVADVSDQERRERAEREFVTNAAHELRTPLTAIAGAVDVLQRGAKERRPERDRFLDVVERQTNRLIALAHALLLLARAQTGAERIRMQPVDVAGLVEDLCLEDDRPLLSVECSGAVVLANPELLSRALENAIENASKHGATSIVVRSSEGAGTVRIDVVDNGAGMGEHDAALALERFYRGDASGSGFGLGLAIVREAVAAMGGEVRLESRLGVGTTVSIVLPSAREQAVAA